MTSNRTILVDDIDFQSPPPIHTTVILDEETINRLSWLEGDFLHFAVASTHDQIRQGVLLIPIDILAQDTKVLQQLQLHLQAYRQLLDLA